MRLVLLILTVFLVTATSAEGRTFKVVQTNVGNINAAGCAAEKYKLCQAPVEARATKALRALKADVVGFQELLPDRKQAAKLLGKGFRVSCDARYGWDCLAVRRSSGLKLVKAIRTRPVFGDCDDGFTTNTGRLSYKKTKIAVILAHPDSSQEDVACRTDQVRDVFKQMPAKGKILAIGDWNLDPYREDDASVDAFDAARERLNLRLATGRAFSVLPGISQTDPTGNRLDSGPSPFAGTSLSDRTIDHVLTRGFKGSCKLKRVDGGGGMDHRAQVCKLRL